MKNVKKMKKQYGRKNERKRKGKDENVKKQT